jgi:hypothetical protein
MNIEVIYCTYRITEKELWANIARPNVNLKAVLGNRNDLLRLRFRLPTSENFLFRIKIIFNTDNNLYKILPFYLVSGSVSFRASWIRIRKYLYGSGSFRQQAKKLIRVLISDVSCLPNDFLSLRTDANVPTKSNKPK